MMGQRCGADDGRWTLAKSGTSKGRRVSGQENGWVGARTRLDQQSARSLLSRGQSRWLVRGVSWAGVTKHAAQFHDAQAMLTADVVQSADGQSQRRIPPRGPRGKMASGQLAEIIDNATRMAVKYGLRRATGLTSYRMSRGCGGLGAEMVQGVVVGADWVWVEVEVEWRWR